MTRIALPTPESSGFLALLSKCVSYFEDIQFSRSFDVEDFEIRQLKIDVARLRLSRWGEAVKVNEVPSFATDGSDDTIIKSTKSILQDLLSLFQQAWTTSNRLQPEIECVGTFTDKDLKGEALNLHKTLEQIAGERQKRSGITEKTRWTVHGDKRSERLCSQITDLLNKLEDLSGSISTRFAELAEQEVEGMDKSGLQLLLKAATNTDTVLADVVRKKLRKTGVIRSFSLPPVELAEQEVEGMDKSQLQLVLEAATNTDKVLADVVREKLRKMGVVGTVISKTNYAEYDREDYAMVHVGDVSSKGARRFETSTSNIASIRAKGKSRVHVGNQYGGPSFWDN